MYKRQEYRLAEAEARFADLIWDREPISSGQLVKLCAKEFSWKSTTTYTVMRRLCDRGIFQNKNSMVTSRIGREEFKQKKSLQFVEESFGGSLPKFLAAFMGAKKLSRKQVDEIQKLIDSYQEETDG